MGPIYVESGGRYAIWRNANWWDARMNDDLRKALTKKWPREDE